MINQKAEKRNIYRRCTLDTLEGLYIWSQKLIWIKKDCNIYKSTVQPQEYSTWSWSILLHCVSLWGRQCNSCTEVRYTYSSTKHRDIRYNEQLWKESKQNFLRTRQRSRKLERDHQQQEILEKTSASPSSLRWSLILFILFLFEKTIYSIAIRKLYICVWIKIYYHRCYNPFVKATIRYIGVRIPKEANWQIVWKSNHIFIYV